ncbi:Zinc carboxypeptidase domain-containing protein [Spironucleus salmonicida]|uniref:Zinc carboxypeptidase domain-containing protein n=1 Tax=Spironucleus salmonicida TaxID=348837 RepID=V6M033_9EUKA|nr:Zinc carboxypeptidase domain-containing protein [Spironucleus salmonicida]|eukprot:EST49386.1 Zinc carboxypeptidase domain-containing protein [Spironucleus salmonicida]
MYGFSTSISEGTDSIDGSELLRQVTLANINKFDEVVAMHKSKIKMPEPPPLYYGLGPQQKDIKTSNNFNIYVPHTEGVQMKSNFQSKPTCICQCSCQFFQPSTLIKTILNTKQQFIVYMNDTGNYNRHSTNLQFESRFESGNLFSASRVKICSTNIAQKLLPDHENYVVETKTDSVTLDGVNRSITEFYPWDQVYYLLIQSDSNSTSHSQWFYFQMDNVMPGVQYSFIIANFVKRRSSYNNGMQILFSDGKGWETVGQNITYGPNSQYIEDKTNLMYKYSSLFFQFTPKNQGKYIVAQHFPYNYMQQQLKINSIIQNYSVQQPNYLFMHKIIQKSILQNDIDLLTITAKESEDSVPIKQRKIIFVTARIHPGETQSSYIMEGFLNYILSQSSKAILIRQNYIIKIIPMLNPDGVILGNYRCNYAGFDLNRKWNSSTQAMTPCIFAVHQVLQEIIDQGGIIQLYIDIHGHFKKNNMFAYSTSVCGYFAGLMKKSPIFNYSDCNFGVSKGKENTGRVVTQKKYLIPYSFCIECSFHRALKSNIQCDIINNVCSDSNSSFQDDFDVQQIKTQDVSPNQNYKTQRILTQNILREGGENLAEHLVYFVEGYKDEIYDIDSLNIQEPGFSDSDDSDEDIDVFKQFKSKKKTVDSKLFSQLMKKQLGIISVKNQKPLAKTKKDSIVKSTAILRPREVTQVKQSQFQRVNQSVIASNTVKQEIKPKRTAEQQQQALNGLVYRKSLPPRPQSQASVRIIYNKNIDLQKEKLAFEKQFYRPKVPTTFTAQTFAPKESGRLSSFSALRSYGIEQIEQRAKELKPDLEKVIKK